MKKRHPQVDEYFRELKNWKSEMEELRVILLESDLKEDFKWRGACYTYDDKNIVMLGAFKENCVISFFKGALLKDPKKILTKPGENTQSARVVRFTDSKEINKLASTLKSYIKEAIQVEQSGLKVESDPEAKPELPVELVDKFQKNVKFKKAFEGLTPGRQRAYIMYFNAAKQSSTRTSRIEQYAERILNGKGMNDCVCGLSQKMPGCDGSHKQLQ